MSPKDRQSVIRNKNLSEGARWVWCVLDTYADNSTNKCHPGRDELISVIGRDKNWVSKKLTELESNGLLMSKKKPSGMVIRTLFSTLNPCPHFTDKGAPENCDPSPCFTDMPCPHFTDMPIEKNYPNRTIPSENVNKSTSEMDAEDHEFWERVI